MGTNETYHELYNTVFWDVTQIAPCLLGLLFHPEDEGSMGTAKISFRGAVNFTWG
jgi:hypothetical protein